MLRAKIHAQKNAEQRLGTNLICRSNFFRVRFKKKSYFFQIEFLIDDPLTQNEVGSTSKIASSSYEQEAGGDIFNPSLRRVSM